jgi:hypothetical protein
VEGYSATSGGPFVLRVTSSESNLTLAPVQGEAPELHRPELVDASVFVRESQVMNHHFEYAQATLDFDQKLFLNEALLCPDAEKSCPLPSSACGECDWSLVPPACWGMDCCDNPCDLDTDQPDPFITVPLGGTSELVNINTSEVQYFRFVIGQSDACAPIQVSVQTEYGNARLVVSDNLPFPEWEQREESGNLFSDPMFHYSQASVTLCPSQFYYDSNRLQSTHTHAPGIYSVGVFALQNTAFRLDISVGTAHPIPQPRERVLCEDVPEEEFRIAGRDDPEALTMSSVWKTV